MTRGFPDAPARCHWFDEVMRRYLASVLAALCLLAAAPAAAGAASLVYLDQGNDVAVARPDGSLAHKVTHATDPENGYKAISVADDGGITAYLSKGDENGNASFVVLDQDGSVRAGPFLFEKSGFCGGLRPFWTATSPDGTFVAVSYWKGSNNCLGGSYTPSVRLTNRNSPTFGTSTYPSYDYLSRPHWLHHPDQRLAGISGGVLQIWQNDAAHMQDWLAVTGGPELQDFDFHPTATKLLLDLANPGTGVRPHTLALVSYTELSTGAAPPTDPAPQILCTAASYATNDTGGGRPLWSPDGSQIAWTTPDGIYVSPAPVAVGETCLLSPQLVIPGGREAHWAPFEVTQPSGGGSTSPPGGSPTASGGSTAKPRGGGSKEGPSSAPTISSAKASATRGAFTIQLKLRQAATVRITVTRKGAKKPLGTLTYKAPKGTFSRKITKVGGKPLRPGPYTVVIKAGSTTKSLAVRVPGNSRQA
ncbi:MAG: hypothetical protein JST08_01555 [Actinobacteria bacterium]|nr:hypothetical protein [Actinomycetota bacterium]